MLAPNTHTGNLSTFV